MSRRRDDRVRFFFTAVGMQIRKRRKELNMTQETLSKGICSNTYVSKMETNSIAVNDDSLHLIMERMDLEYTLGMNVEEQLVLFDRALDAYLEGDYEEVERVGYEVRNVEFAILTDIARMIRDVERGDAKAVRRTIDNLSRFLESMDGYAFGVFMFYAAAGMIALDRPGDAVEILEELSKTEYAFVRFWPMIEYLKAVGYGRTGRLLKAADALHLAEHAFVKARNFRRLAELAVIRYEFGALAGHDEPPIADATLALLSEPFRDRYHIARAAIASDPTEAVGMVAPGSRFRPRALFLLGMHRLGIGDAGGFEAVRTELSQIEKDAGTLDYAMWLERAGAGDDVAYKDFLIAEVLPCAETTNDLPLLRRATDAIAGILIGRKRYKDAIQYKMKETRFRNRSEGIAEERFAADPVDLDSEVE